MALQHTLLLTLALTAVAVVNCNGNDPPPETTVLPPEKPNLSSTPTPDAHKGSCNETQRETIDKTWTSIKTCFSHLVKGEDGVDKCKTNKDILEFKTPLLDALECAVTSTTRNRTATNIGAVLNMMNTTVAKYKSLVVNDTFSTCVKNNMDGLKTCVKNVKLTNGTADKLGEFTIGKNILGLDFENSGGKGQFKNINVCVKNVLSKNETCKQVLDFTQALFEIAGKTANIKSGASIPISSLVVMIAACLFALYF